MIKNITIGSDPEFFIFKDEDVVSSIGIIEGTKWVPQKVAEGYDVLKDNVLLEMNVPPANTREEFINNMIKAKELASGILEIGGYKLVSADSAKFPPEMLASREAKTFGCAPYMNAWTLNIGNPTDLVALEYRVAGTHIHIGYTLPDGFKYNREVMDILIARAFDYFAIYPSRQIYDDPVRSKFYGDFGNYRNKEYGVEVRSLGGHFSKDEYLGWIYDQVKETLRFCSNEANCDLLRDIKSPENNTLENYNILEIKLEKQLYGNNNHIINTVLAEKQA